MADDAVLVENPHRYPAYDEGDAAAAITPGHLVEFDTNGDVAVHSVAAEVNPLVAFADLPVDPEKDKEDAYATSERVRVQHGMRGQVYDALLSNNETIAVGDRLVSAGNGELRELDTAGGDAEAAVIAEAVEAASPTGGAVRLQVRVL